MGGNRHLCTSWGTGGWSSMPTKVPSSWRGPTVSSQRPALPNKRQEPAAVPYSHKSHRSNAGACPDDRGISGSPSDHRYATCFGSSITSLRHSSARARMWVLGHQGLAWAQWWPVLLTPVPAPGRRGTTEGGGPDPAPGSGDLPGA